MPRLSGPLPLASWATASRALTLAASLLAACGSGPDAGTENPNAALSPPPSSAVVQTSGGTLQGGLNTRSRYFLGIPYAAAPTGNRRWRPPAAHPGWSGVRLATNFGSFCQQLAALAPPPAGLVPDEDCLSLNIWTPWPVPARAPVMLFIHGGGFVQGYSASPQYDGQAIAERSGTVVVTINYRLGALGFLAHTALGAESGQFGLMDQQAALRWVQQNIAAFGGNPSNVTIFGESAGGFSVAMHLVAPGSQGLFQRAVSESGPASWNLPTLAQAYQQGETLAVAVGCAAGSTSDPAACLRGVPAEQLIRALPPCVAMLYGPGTMWMPVANGTTMPDQPLRLLEQGRFSPVPVIFGTNQDEGTLFAVASMMVDGTLTRDDVITDEEYRQILLETFGANRSPQIYARYDPARYATGASLNAPTRAFADMLGDWFFGCPTRRTVRAISNKLAASGSKGQAFLYRFTWSPTQGALAMLGSHHGAELPFVFHNLTDAMPMVAYTPADTQLSDAMVSLWTSFARGGTPNASQVPASWPAYAPATDRHLVLDHAFAEGQHLEQAQCDFWDKLGIYGTP